MKNNRGIADIAIVIVVVALLAVAGVVLFSQRGKDETQQATSASRMMESNPPTPSPVSEEDDIETLEMELNDTVVGDFEADINSMQEEAGEL